MIRISVIVPVYNVEPYVKQCITSIISQTERNIEIIVVDDGSSDNSRAILTELAEQDKRIKVICQKNQGVSVARNKGLEVACGEWICFVDGDDMLPSEALSKLLSVAECEKSDICI